jgi:probable F420-dependent oxidoreductase
MPAPVHRDDPAPVAQVATRRRRDDIDPGAYHWSGTGGPHPGDRSRTAGRAVFVNRAQRNCHSAAKDGTLQRTHYGNFPTLRHCGASAASRASGGRADLATIDYLSRGRLTLGIGVGWCREEFEAIGAAPFDDRGNVTDEWMAVCRELWTADAPSFSGKYVRFDNVIFLPKPVQAQIPIWVGGESGPALRRTARYADCWYPVGTNPQFPLNTVSRFKRGLERLRNACERAGRDPKEVSVALRVALGPGIRTRTSIGGEPDMFSGGESDWVADIRELQALGISAIDVRLFGYTPTEGVAEAIDHMHRFRDGVMAKL